MSLSRLSILDPIRRATYTRSGDAMRKVLQRLEALALSSAPPSCDDAAPSTHNESAVDASAQLRAWVAAELNTATPTKNESAIDANVQLRAFVAAELGVTSCLLSNANLEAGRAQTKMAYSPVAEVENKQNIPCSSASMPPGTQVLSHRARDVFTALSLNELDAAVNSNVILGVLDVEPQFQPAWDFDASSGRTGMVAGQTWDPVGWDCDILNAGPQAQAAWGRELDACSPRPADIFQDEIWDPAKWWESLPNREVSRNVQDGAGTMARDADAAGLWSLQTVGNSSRGISPVRYGNWSSQERVESVEHDFQVGMQNASEPLLRYLPGPASEVALFGTALAPNATHTMTDSSAIGQFHFHPDPRAPQSIAPILMYTSTLRGTEETRKLPVKCPYGDIGQGRPSRSPVAAPDARSAPSDVGAPGESTIWKVLTSFPTLVPSLPPL
ncbi:hypothetical protein C8R45DRAFT_1166654 [Mycena sanguinolenta]|nr:hypothetical protein C8R45DRAFT_1166654 [Mycena sanguinolenta]